MSAGLLQVALQSRAVIARRRDRDVCLEVGDQRALERAGLLEVLDDDRRPVSICARSPVSMMVFAELSAMTRSSPFVKVPKPIRVGVARGWRGRVERRALRGGGCCATLERSNTVLAARVRSWARHTGPTDARTADAFAVDPDIRGDCSRHARRAVGGRRDPPSFTCPPLAGAPPDHPSPPPTRAAGQPCAPPGRARGRPSRPARTPRKPGPRLRPRAAGARPRPGRRRPPSSPATSRARARASVASDRSGRTVSSGATSSASNPSRAARNADQRSASAGTSGAFSSTQRRARSCRRAAGWRRTRRRCPPRRCAGRRSGPPATGWMQSWSRPTGRCGRCGRWPPTLWRGRARWPATRGRRRPGRGRAPAARGRRRGPGSRGVRAGRDGGPPGDLVERTAGRAPGAAADSGGRAGRRPTAGR